VGAPAEDRLPLAPGGSDPAKAYSTWRKTERAQKTTKHPAKTSKSHSFKWPL